MPSSSIFAIRILAASRIELPLHQRRHQVDDGHAAPLHLQTARGLEPEQAAADDHGLVPGPARRSSSRVSSSVRKVNTPSLSRPLMGGIHAELPVASSSVSYGVTLPSSPVTVFADRIDVDDADADAKVDLVAPIPLERVDDDVVGALLAGEHGRQHARGCS